MLRPFDGRASLLTYLTFKLGDLLASRIQDLFEDNVGQAWSAFERFFKKDIMRAIARYFPLPSKGQALEDGSSHEDLYQEICCLLVEQGYRRIMDYDGRGSFTGYVRRVIQNLCMDMFRKREGRRRLPETISRLSVLEQEAYKLIHWENCTRDEVFQLLKDDEGTRYSRNQVERALACVEKALKSRGRTSELPEVRVQSLTSLRMRHGEGLAKEFDVSDPDSSPEKALIDAEEERAQTKVFDLVKQAVTKLPEHLRLYLELRFYSTPPKPPREIARLMGRTEPEIYKIRQDAMSILAAKLKESGIKNLELSV